MNKILLVFTGLSLVTILLGINRGFDISDEGVYMLLANPAQENIAGVFNYDLFFKLFFKASGIEFGIVGMRLLRLFTCFIAAASLTIFWRNVWQKEENFISVFLIALIGIFSSYGLLAQSLSYNSINLLCGCVWLGLISSRKLTIQKVFLIGTTLALLFYSKPTVCVILGLLTIGFLVWNSKQRFYNIKMLPILGLPLLVFECIFFFQLGDTGFSRALAAREMLEFRPDYHFLSILKYSLVGLFWTLLAVSSFILAGFLRRINRPYYRIILFLGVLSLIVISYFTTITKEINHVVLLTTLAVMGFYIDKSLFDRMNIRQTVFFILLIIFPFILHFGSNFYFLRLGIHYWVFWVIAVLFIFKIKNIRGEMYYRLLIPVFSFILVCNGVSIYSFNAYNYLEKTGLWEYKDGKSIRLPEREVAFYRRLLDLTPNSDSLNVLPIYTNPGLVYMLGMTHPKTPGLWSSLQLQYFFPDEKFIDVILYNDTFEFPFEKAHWQLKNEIQMNTDEKTLVFWKR